VIFKLPQRSQETGKSNPFLCLALKRVALFMVLAEDKLTSLIIVQASVFVHIIKTHPLEDKDINMD